MLESGYYYDPDDVTGRNYKNVNRWWFKLDDVLCNGTEDRILDCQHSPLWDFPHCGVHKTVNIRCDGVKTIKVKGESNISA